MNHLTLEELQLYAPISISDYNTAKFNPFADWALREVLRALPATMQPIIRTLDFTDKPQLETFWKEHIKPWLAMACYYKMQVQAGVNLTADGSRTVSEQYSQESSPQDKATVQAATQLEANRYKQDAMWEYEQRRYVFDDVAYPPTPNMQGYWQPYWAGLTYGFANGAWGWYGANGIWLGFSGQLPTIGSSSSAISII